jgi:hypothetical protein
MHAFADSPSKNSNADCGDLLKMAERELSGFFGAVTKLFGPEQAEISADDWLQELTETDSLPASAREWRRITVRVAARLGSRVLASQVVNSSPTMVEIA